ncbi:MAG: hypothetical protein HRT44_08810 [Bdellovibrionales bacterium]|nr:hypothetical protein [Bdellovibrionales bacterium]NQZ19341.1 hypothetical protein [Bdellovibrionales bacterium]
MNKKLMFAVAVIVAVYLIFFNGSSGENFFSSEPQVEDELADALEGLPAKNTFVKEDNDKLSPEDLAAKEERALESMVEMLSIQIKPTSTIRRMLLELQHRGLEPVVQDDSNPHTGRLYVVRTNNSLPGTRYFHAQYYDDAHQKAFLQHMSFEFRPGPGAQQKVIKVIQEKFPNLGEPTFQNDSFTAWKVDKNYHFWVKTMDEYDLVSDEYSAYSKRDVGTIKVGLDWEVHAENHHASHKHNHNHDH